MPLLPFSLPNYRQGHLIQNLAAIASEYQCSALSLSITAPCLEILYKTASYPEVWSRELGEEPNTGVTCGMKSCCYLWCRVLHWKYMHLKSGKFCCFVITMKFCRYTIQLFSLESISCNYSFCKVTSFSLCFIWIWFLC